MKTDNTTPWEGKKHDRKKKQDAQVFMAHIKEIQE